MPKALVVDFGGVLTTPLHDAMEVFARNEGIDFQDLVRAALAAYAGADDDLVTRFETGHVPEDEFVAAFATRLTEMTGKPIEPKGLLRRLFATLELEEEMVELLRAARRRGLKTALLSNSWGLDLYPRELLQEVCDVVVISGEVGMRKPDPAIFELTLQKLGVEAHEAIFVDDHPGHLKTALSLGMHTVLHRSPEGSIAEVEELLSGSS